MTGGDFDKSRRAWRWPIRDVLVAFAEAVKVQAAEQFRHEQLLYATGGMKKKPTVPAILRDDGGS